MHFRIDLVCAADRRMVPLADRCRQYRNVEVPPGCWSQTQRVEEIYPLTFDAHHNRGVPRANLEVPMYDSEPQKRGQPLPLGTESQFRCDGWKRKHSKVLPRCGLDAAGAAHDASNIAKRRTFVAAAPALDVKD